jgi:hypothetical protein
MDRVLLLGALRATKTHVTPPSAVRDKLAGKLSFPAGISLVERTGPRPGHHDRSSLLLTIKAGRAQQCYLRHPG